MRHAPRLRGLCNQSSLCRTGKQATDLARVHRVALAVGGHIRVLGVVRAELGVDRVHLERLDALEREALAGAHVLLRHRDHELDAVQLVHLGGARVVVHGHDVALRVAAAQLLDDRLAHHVVGQAGEGLRADDVGRAVVDEVEHLGVVQGAAGTAQVHQAVFDGGLEQAQDGQTHGVLGLVGLDVIFFDSFKQAHGVGMGRG